MRGARRERVPVVRRVDPDSRRFRDIVRGKIRDNLKHYISRGELIARQGKNSVSVPLPQIDIPNFRFGKQEQGGVGQGPGEEGQPIGGEEAEAGPEAGDQPGEHVLEVDVSLEELAAILGDELELPNIEPKGTESVHTVKERYTGIDSQGPESLRHFKRTFKAALKRQIQSGVYDPKNPIIVPMRDDRRYRSWKTHDQRSADMGVARYRQYVSLALPHCRLFPRGASRGYRPVPNERASGAGRAAQDL